MEKQKSHTLPTQHSPITKHMKRENMCKIDDEFFITTQGKIYFKGQVYELEDCDFNEGAKIVIHYGEKKIEKLLKKDTKIKVIPDQFIRRHVFISTRRANHDSTSSARSAHSLNH
jgi:hypothetical protein